MTSEGEVRAPSEAPFKLPVRVVHAPGSQQFDIRQADGLNVAVAWSREHADFIASRLNAEPSRAPGVGEAPLGWRSIATAPKDGTCVLVCPSWPDDADVCHWMEADEFGASGWYDANNFEADVEPTHWLPLPPPLGSARVPEGETP